MLAKRLLVLSMDSVYKPKIVKAEGANMPNSVFGSKYFLKLVMGLAG